MPIASSGAVASGAVAASDGTGVAVAGAGNCLNYDKLHICNNAHSTRKACKGFQAYNGNCTSY